MNITIIKSIYQSGHVSPIFYSLQAHKRLICHNYLLVFSSNRNSYLPVKDYVLPYVVLFLAVHQVPAARLRKTLHLRLMQLFPIILLLSV